MMKLSAAVAALCVIVTAAKGAPVGPIGDGPHPDIVQQQVRIVCYENGHCYRSAGRRPTARWIYGDGAFVRPGPYAGPGNYGHPGRHHRWSIFGL